MSKSVVFRADQQTGSVLDHLNIPYRHRLREYLLEKLVASFKANKQLTEEEIEAFREQTFYELSGMTIKQIVEKYSGVHYFSAETLEHANNDVKEVIFQ